jgi:hypothetical protein
MRFVNCVSQQLSSDPFPPMRCLTLAALVAVSDNDTAAGCVFPNGSGRLGTGANDKGGND